MVLRNVICGIARSFVIVNAVRFCVHWNVRGDDYNLASIGEISECV